MGVRWNKSEASVQWDEEWERQDLEEGRSQDSVTLELFREMANSIAPDFQFTVDTKEDHRDGRITILDFQAWRVEEDPGIRN